MFRINRTNVPRIIVYKSLRLSKKTTFAPLTIKSMNDMRTMMKLTYQTLIEPARNRRCHYFSFKVICSTVSNPLNTSWAETFPAGVVKNAVRYVLNIAVGTLVFAVFSTAAAAQENGNAVTAPAYLFNESKSLSAITEWLSSGEYANLDLDGTGSTPVHYAATLPIDILRVVIKHGGDCNRRNNFRATPLHFAAAQHGFGPGPDSIKLLVGCGSDPNMRDSRGNTPLHAVYSGVEGTFGLTVGLQRWVAEDKVGRGEFAILISLLADAKANPDIKNLEGETPLMQVVKENYSIVSNHRWSHVQKLLEYGADPDTRNNKGETALITSVNWKTNSTNYGEDSENLILALLNGGADPNLTDSDGDTPLIHAARHEDDIATETEALLGSGADPCIADQRGKLPIDYASKGSSVRMLLHEAGGYLDPNTGICARDAIVAMEREKALNLGKDSQRRIQSCLKSQGFDPGVPDGIFGPRTRQGLKGWQTAQGYLDDQSIGYLTSDQANTLLDLCKTVLEPNCTGMTEGSECWKELANRPGCYIWDSHYYPTQTAEWSGSCSADGIAEGKGTVNWKNDDGSGHSFTGTLVNGKLNGHFIGKFSDSNIWEGTIVDEEYHGILVKRGSQGEDWGCWRNGERVDNSICIVEIDESLVSTKSAAVRSGPGKDYERLGTLRPNAQVSATAKAGKWLWIEAPDGVAGYVHVSLLAEAAMPIAGETFQDCSQCPVMVVVPQGTFTMGSPASEEGRYDREGPQHQVTISNPFAAGKFEVTFREWDACVSEGGCSHRPHDFGWGRGNRPVVDVSWNDAQQYVSWLSRKTGEQYRLLSESEWEYVARAGTTGPYHFGSTFSPNLANYQYSGLDGTASVGSFPGKTVSVGSFPANRFGLHDVHGNVWEWVEDCWHENYQGAPQDGSAWITGGNCGLRVLRGGSWLDAPRNLRSADRNWSESGIRSFLSGFRVARTLTP